jgi:hypothetical protein
MFSNDGSVVNWVDESFAPTTGSGEFLPTTDLAARAWHPAGTHKTGRMFFSDLATGAFLSEFQVVDLRPEPGAYCSAHMGMPIMGGHKDLLVNAWYMGGADVIDFTNPRAPQRRSRSTTWRRSGQGARIPGAHVQDRAWGARLRLGRGPQPQLSQGFVVFRARVGRPNAPRWTT